MHQIWHHADSCAKADTMQHVWHSWHHAVHNRTDLHEIAAQPCQLLAPLSNGSSCC